MSDEKKPLKVKTGEQIFDLIDNCFSRNVSNSFNPNKEEYSKYEKESAMLKSQKWVSVEGLAAELKRKAKWRVEEKMSTKMEGETSVTRFRPRRYVRLDEALVLLGVKEQKEIAYIGSVPDDSEIVEAQKK